MKQIPLIIDTDPGIDDAVAIALAVFNPRFDVRLITTVAGNVSIEATTTNALKLMAYYGKDVPVARGAAEPLIRQLDDASDIHGKTGMEGFDFPEPKTELLLDKHAVEAMHDEIMASAEPVTVTRGNKGVMAEFNIFVDPEAAKIVLTSGLDITMATLDAGLGTVIPPEKTAQLKDMGKVGLMAHDLFQRYRKRSFGTGLKMYDACAVACLLEPDLFDMTKAFVDVEIAGELTAGCTVVDLKGYLKREPNATVTTGVHADRFCDWFMDGIAHCA